MRGREGKREREREKERGRETETERETEHILVGLPPYSLLFVPLKQLLLLKAYVALIRIALFLPESQSIRSEHSFSLQINLFSRFFFL